MKLRLILSLPLILASCGDLTPIDQEEPAVPAPQKLTASAPATAAPAPAAVAAPIPVIKKTTAPAPPVPGPENPLGFLDPNTTDELLTEAKKKTVTKATSLLPPTPKVEGDSAINVAPPKLPEIKITE